MDIHSYLRQRFSQAVKRSCSKKGCKLKLEQLVAYQITSIDAEMYSEICGHRAKLCDYLIFLTHKKLWRLHAAAVEMKSGGVDARIATEQIARGAEEIEQLIEETKKSGVPQNVFDFYPLLLYGQMKSPFEVKI